MRQRYHGDRKRRRAAGPLALGLAAVAGAYAAFRPFRLAVEGESMAPALMPGDWVLVVRPRRIRRGDVVVLEDPRTPGFELVKRIVGLPGDRLEVTGTWEAGDVAGVVLGAGEYWVKGDAPERSTDSRTFGPVRRERIRGVVLVRYWSAEWLERRSEREAG